MFKGKVYLYKNINGKEEKVEKKFDSEKDFNEYINKSPELQKMEKDFKELEFPDNFKNMKNMFDDFDMRLFPSEKKGFFNELNKDFEQLFKKTKKLLDK